ncbi:MAG TPA: ester cyclase [Candidatus Dormibacteraeota bacterium]|jgi:predicted SnoaL-like aldol condensation-catalyzing enzyme|nr:ester cyclase [Candidatus Dormibacteraeota bacterium]
MTAQENRRIVLDFYEAVVNRRDFTAASAYLGDVYIQHRADVPDGVDGLRRFMLRERSPQTRVDVRRVFVDGDHVILHAHVVPSPDDRGSAHVDIFRVDGGKVVEHWDVDEPIPAETANSNGVV